MRVVIVGAGGHGRVLLDTFRCQGDVVVAGFIDDAYQDLEPTLAGVPVLGDSSVLSRAQYLGHTHFIVAIGDNRTRAAKFQECTAAGLEPLSAVHPTAVIAADALVGPGSQVMAGVVVSTGAVVGCNVILNTGCTVDHDCRIGDHAFIAPGVHLGGAVQVGEAAFIGIGASVIQCRSIGQGSTVGAGAVVLEDIPPGVVAVGVPTRVVRCSDNR